MLTFLLFSFSAFCADKILSSVEFKYGKDKYRIEVRMAERARVYRPGETSCYNPYRNPEVEGDCSIVLVKEGKDVFRVNFESCLFVNIGGKWKTPIEPLKVFMNGEGQPIVIFSQYGTCATGVRMTVLWLNVKSMELRPVIFTSFHGVWKGEIYAQDVEVVGEEIWIRMYDQSVGGSYLQFSKVEDGIYSLIGYYTQAGGSLPVAEEILRKKLNGRLY